MDSLQLPSVSDVVTVIITVIIVNRMYTSINKQHSQLHEFNASVTQQFLHLDKVIPRKTFSTPHRDVYFNYTKSNFITRLLYIPGFKEPHPEICPYNGIDVRLIIMVTSSSGRFQHRQNVRQTWGSFGRRRDIKIAFIIGKNNDSQPRDVELENENYLYGDIVLTNNYDGYNNLSLKTLNILEWVSTYCQKAQFLLKTDDDMLINVYNLLQVLDNNHKATRTIFGRLCIGWSPIRADGEKSYISNESYPQEFYPQFTTGGAYVVTRDAITELFEAALDYRFFELEDVFITGIVAQHLGILRKGHPGFINNLVFLNECSRAQMAISVHGLPTVELFEYWYMMHDRNFICD